MNIERLKEIRNLSKKYLFTPAAIRAGYKLHVHRALFSKTIFQQPTDSLSLSLCNATIRACDAVYSPIRVFRTKRKTLLQSRAQEFIYRGINSRRARAASGYFIKLGDFCSRWNDIQRLRRPRENSGFVAIRKSALQKAAVEWYPRGNFARTTLRNILFNFDISVALFGCKNDMLY